MERVQVALEERGITIGQIESEGGMSVVFHIPAEQNDTVREFRAEFESEHNVILSIIDRLEERNVLIVDSGEQEIPELNDEVDGTLADGNTEDGETLTPEEIEEREAEFAAREEAVSEEETPEETPAEDGVPLDETIKSYRILGMVDYTDEQGNIVGQLPVGSVHELPAYVGDLAVEEGRAEEVQ